MSEKKQNNKKTNHDILQPAIVCVSLFVIAVAIFGAGVFIGGMKAKFSYRWAENYHKNFAGPREGFLKHWPKPLPPPGDFIEGYGSFGEIIELNDSGFVIKGRKNIEKIIVIIEDTVIKKGRETITEGLKIGDKVTDQFPLAAKGIAQPAVK